MSGVRCPVCGAPDAACGHQELRYPPIPSLETVITTSTGAVDMAEDTKVYLPRQRVRRGTAGYRGKNIVVVDPDTGKTDAAATKAANKPSATGED
jgi:hypothetical protein